MLSRVTSLPSLRRFQLRQFTAAEHEALDASVDAFDSTARYADYVRSVHAFRMPVERALRRMVYPASFGGWSPLSIAGALEDDMQSLGLSRPRQQAFDPEASREAVFGILYTLEGSSLGAQVLVRRAAALGIGTENGAAHLARQAAGVGSWKSYCALLEAEPELDMEQVCLNASAVFSLARKAFERADA